MIHTGGNEFQSGFHDSRSQFERFRLKGKKAISEELSTRAVRFPLKRQEGTLHLTQVEERHKVEIDDVLSVGTVSTSEIYTTTESHFEEVVLLLSGLDQNKGLQLLLDMTRPQPRQAEAVSAASHAIVYGIGWEEETLQEALLSLLWETEDAELNEIGLSTMATCSSEQMHFSAAGGKVSALYGTVLRILCNSMEEVLSCDLSISPQPLIFEPESFWYEAVQVIADYLEALKCTEAMGWSLKALRLLFTLEPTIMAPLLQYRLLPSILSLEECGRSRGLPMIESEATKLLLRVGIVPFHGKRIAI